MIIQFYIFKSITCNSACKKVLEKGLDNKTKSYVGASIYFNLVLKLSMHIHIYIYFIAH